MKAKEKIEVRVNKCDGSLSPAGYNTCLHVVLRIIAGPLLETATVFEVSKTSVRRYQRQPSAKIEFQHMCVG